MQTHSHENLPAARAPEGEVGLHCSAGAGLWATVGSGCGHGSVRHSQGLGWGTLAVLPQWAACPAHPSSPRVPPPESSPYGEAPAPSLHLLLGQGAGGN